MTNAQFKTKRAAKLFCKKYYTLAETVARKKNKKTAEYAKEVIIVQYSKKRRLPEGILGTSRAGKPAATFSGRKGQGQALQLRNDK